MAAWPNGAAIPARHTCDDPDVAPALSWTTVPVDAVELAVTMVDLDANFVHWVMFGISPTRTGLAEDEVPPGAIQWPNDFGDEGYGGPVPARRRHAHVPVHGARAQPAGRSCR